jgi:Bax protein
MADAGSRIRIGADQNEPNDLTHDLVETPPGAELADTLIAEAPLGFDPADAVFITALLPDWSAWDDAMRLAAMQERTLIRNAGTANYQPELPEKFSPTPVSARSLSDLFDRHNFRLGGATIVPALFIQRLPSDLSSVTQAADRKALFLRALLPFVVAANERITRQRERLLDLLPLLEQGLPLGRDDRRFMDRLQEEFRVSRPDPEELLRRMDIVPPSLALAQAAEESGWGTSRPAREDNALFGQMVFHEGGMKLREFETLRETVEAYIRNLNTHRAYADFRQKRAQLRRANRPIDSHQLAGHIERYSERGVDYIATIRGLMTSNGLRNFDDARLSDIEFLVQAVAR